MYEGPQKYIKTHLNERGEQVYWSYEILNNILPHAKTQT